jgi:hypothetical protein
VRIILATTIMISRRFPRLLSVGLSELEIVGDGMTCQMTGAA